MKTKILVDVLKQVSLTPVEQELFDLNILFLNHKLIMIKRIGIEGIRSLVNNVNFRIAIEKSKHK